MKQSQAVSGMSASRDRSRALGSILVEQGRLTAKSVDEIQSYSRAHGLRFGDAAVRLELLTPTDIENALAQQFNYPILARGQVSDEVIAAYMPQSALVEPLRALRSRLVLRWLNESSRKVLAICSPTRGEGRSWLAANLATMFAQIGERTLLIDGDLRHPRQHELFNIDNDVGLSSLLTGRAGREIARRIHPQLTLCVLPAGLLPPNPQELLERPVFDVVIDRFAEQFSVVIVDTPALDESSDAQVIASRAGSALMLARRNYSQHRQLKSGLLGFQEAGVNVVGSVIFEH